MEAKSQSQKYPDVINNPSDFGNKDFQHVSEFASCAPRWPSGMCYGYNEGCLVLVVHISLWRLHGEPCEFCATFYRTPKEFDCGRDEDSLIIVRPEAKLPSRNIGDDHIEQPVLINIIEIGEKPEQRRELTVRSIVRLRSLDSCLRSTAQRCNTPLDFRIGERLGAVSDRKLQEAPIGGRIDATLCNGDRIEDAIKSGSEVMDAVSRQKRQLINRRLPFDFDHEAVAATLGIDLSGDSIGLRILPCDEFRLNSIEVFFGTADFQPAASELRSDHAVY